MTPRAQMVRVMLGAVAAVLVGAGPAIAWDMNAQPPKAAQPSPWQKPPTPWKDAGRHMADAVKGIARLYLPKSPAVVAQEQAEAEAAASASAAALAPPPAPSASVSVVPSVPGLHVYRSPPMPSPPPMAELY
jgi:hypothetical protein